MTTIIARAPLRVSFAGGGTDISDYSDRFGGAVLSATVDRYAYTLVSKRNDNKTVINAVDIEEKIVISSDNKPENSEKLKLHSEIYAYFLERMNINFYPLNITTFCECPIGAGLGASSTIVVSIVKALSTFFRIPMEPYQVASVAYEIERIRCNMDGGKQDQFAAAYGGFNFLEFKKNGDVEVSSVNPSGNFTAELESMLLLYFTGKSRLSSTIIKDQKESVHKEKHSVIAALDELKVQAFKMNSCIRNEDKGGMLDAFRGNWEHKKKTSSQMLTPQIDYLLAETEKMGSMVGKVSGAGGGGFLMLWVPLVSRQKVINFLNEQGGQITECNFSTQGAVAWETDELVIGPQLSLSP